MLPSLMKFNLETVVLQVTTRCPYNCPQCYMKRGDRDMPIDVAKGIIDDSVRMGAGAVQITGGEPMIYPHIFELIEYANRRGLYSLLATSGYNCSDETYARLKAKGLTAMCVSINGISEEVNGKSRSSFDEALRAIKIMHRYDALCFINVVVTDDNIDELEVLGEYARRNNVYGVNILYPIPSEDGAYVPSFSHDTLLKLVEITHRDPDFYNVERCHREYWSFVNSNKFTCRDIGKTTFFVNVDGTVSPCSKMTKHKYSSLTEMFERFDDWEGGCYDTKQ